jgi:8-oxo-dGTP diphosphatase
MWFFVAHQPNALRDQIRFGDEGQYWELWTPEAFLEHPRAISRLKTRLAMYLEEQANGR